MAKRDVSRTSQSMENAMQDVPLEQETLLVAALNHALEAEGNFIGLYDAAIRKVGEEAGAKLREFRGDHERHVLEIRGALDGMGAPVLVEESRPTPMGVALARTLEEASDEEALMLDFCATEDFSRRLYHWMTTIEAPEPIARLGQKALDDEERHYKWAAERCGIEARPVA